jgi:hypothetical protein
MQLATCRRHVAVSSGVLWSFHRAHLPEGPAVLIGALVLNTGVCTTAEYPPAALTDLSRCRAEGDTVKTKMMKHK